MKLTIAMFARATASTNTGRSAMKRFAATLLMLAYAAIQVAIPVLDAQTNHAERIVAHWQDASETNCPPLHDPAVCQVCQQMGQAGWVALSGPLLPPSYAGATEPTLDLCQPPLRAFSFLRPPTRAPPVT